MKLPAFKVKVKLPGGAGKLPKPLLRATGFGALAAIIVGMAAALWLSGSGETRRAVEEGRRVLIRLDNGTIEGHPLTLEKKEAPPVASAKPEPEPRPESKPEARSSENPPPEESGSAPASALPPDTAPLPTDTPVIPAAVSPPMPNQSLEEKSDTGMLPVIGPDGTKPWRYYARPYERKGSLPLIALVITGLGEGQEVTAAATRLPPEITLSFSPYARDVANWASTARVTGHETMIDLPLEPTSFPADDPGPYGLLVGKGVVENNKRLEWLMARFQGYVGFLTPQNEVFTANQEALKALLQAVSNRGLLLVVGHAPAKDDTRQMLQASIAANLTADTLIDEDPSPASIQTRLSSLEQIARERGYAVGIAQPYPVTMQQIASWAATLQKDGFVLAPVTFIAKLHSS